MPELASRQHIRDICGVVERALDEAATTWSDLGAVAVTQGPGPGRIAARRRRRSRRRRPRPRGLPLVAVHHLAGHIESLVLQNGELPLPAVVLVVSGGHTSLYLDRARRRRIGCSSRTRDDAAGEAYDKVAKLLGLGYPGGPIIDRLREGGNDRAVALPTTRLTHADRNAPELKGDLDFSFSGLKTAVLRYVAQRSDGGRAPSAVPMRTTPVPFLRTAKSRTSAPAFSASWSTALIERPFDGGAAVRREERRHRRRRVGQQPPARGAARSTAKRARCRRSCQPEAVDRQRRDDRRRRPAEVPRRHHRRGSRRSTRIARSIAGRLSQTSDRMASTPTTSGSTRRSGRSSSASPTRSRRS